MKPVALVLGSTALFIQQWRFCMSVLVSRFSRTHSFIVRAGRISLHPLLVLPLLLFFFVAAASAQTQTVVGYGISPMSNNAIIAAPRT